MGWLNQVIKCGDGYTRGELGVAFFKGAALHSVRFGRIMLDWYFEHSAVDMAYGMTPAPNTAAWKYARAIGMTLAGPIPSFASWKGELCDVWVSCLARKDWNLSTMSG